MAAGRSVSDLVARDVRVRFSQVGSGPSVVCVHDFLECKEAWDDLADALSDSFNVVCIDLPGFGESEKPSVRRYPYGVPAFAEAVADVVATLPSPRASLLGHGLGAAVAVALATSQPASVTSIVTFGVPFDGGAQSPMVRIARLPAVGPLVVRQFAGRWALRKHFDAIHRPVETGDESAYLSRVQDAFDSPAAREAAVATALSMQDARAVRAAVPRLTHPLLAFVEAGDGATRAGRWCKNAPHARVEALPNGAFPKRDALPRVGSLVRQHLEDAARGVRK
jgi:pimeloyl-ACP methyl ester carboxylesterase